VVKGRKAVKTPYEILLTIMERRHSTRHFSDRPVTLRDVENLMWAFLSVPQAGGDRSLHTRILIDPEQIANLAAVGTRAYDRLLQGVDSPLIREEMANYGRNFFWFGSAPLLIAAIVRKPPAFLTSILGADVDLVWGADQTAAMGIQAMLLAAEAVGMGGCCLSGPLVVRNVLEKELELAPGERLSLLAAFGHLEKSPKKED
jgi:nitroreductase